MEMFTNPNRIIQYLYALLVAIALVFFIDMFTNSIPPSWDGKYYIDMAVRGITDNPNLVAPFAYRPGMPYLSHAVASLFSISIQDGFRVVVRLSSVLLLLALFTLSRRFTRDYRQALLVMVVLGLSWQHIKFPIFMYSLVDVAAYPLIVTAFWALITKRLWLCLLVSAIGLLFKEFLAIPWLLLVLHLVSTYWHNRSRRDLLLLVTSVVVGLALILLPRLYIPVVRTVQFIDPINGINAFNQMLSATFDKGRLFNIVYSTAGYWLPTILLLTRSRFETLRASLKQLKILPAIMVYFFLVLLLALYGGDNIPIFTSYSVAIQAVVLALIIRQGISAAEVILMVAIMIAFNKIILHIPSPLNSFSDFNLYRDFYGGGASRVGMASVLRSFELAMYISFTVSIRWVIAKFHKSPPQ